MPLCCRFGKFHRLWNALAVETASNYFELLRNVVSSTQANLFELAVFRLALQARNAARNKKSELASWTANIFPPSSNSQRSTD